MSDTLEIFGTEYTGVTGVKATDDNGQTKTYVRPQGTKSITQNGTGIDVTNYASVDVSVSGGGGGLEYEEGTWTPNEDIARGTIHFLNTHTTAPSIVEITDTDTATAPATYSNISMIFYNVHTLHGDGFPYNTTSTYYGVVQYLYYSSSQSASGQRTYLVTSTGSASSGTPGYWADTTAIYPYTMSTSRYWRAGRTYKWIAVWAPTT